MSTYTHPQPVFLRIGRRPESEIGTVHCDNRGRVDAEEMASFLVAVGEYIRHLADVEREKVGMSNEDSQ